MNINFVCAQTDEEFLAEAFFGGMTEKGSKIYVVKDFGITLLMGSIESYHKIFSEKFGISDTTIVNELKEYYVKSFEHLPEWNPEAEVFHWNPKAEIFQSAKYKQLKFIPSTEAISLNIKGKNVKYIYKPLFTKNREYALVSVTYYTYHKYGWSYRLRVKPWKNIWKAKYECNTAKYNMLFKKNNGKWERIEEYLTTSSS